MQDTESLGVATLENQIPIALRQTLALVPNPAVSSLEASQTPAH